MDRKEFLRASCGLFGCMGVGLLAAPDSAAEPEEDRLGAMFTRFAWFIEAVGQTLDPVTQARLLEGVGRSCAQEYGGRLIEKHRGNVDGLLAEIQTHWVERAQYDRENGIIRVVDRKRAACACPLVKQPPFAGDTLCHCSRGFQKEMYGEVTVRPVDLTIDRALLRGDDHCEFSVRLS